MERNISQQKVNMKTKMNNFVPLKQQRHSNKSNNLIIHPSVTSIKQNKKFQKQQQLKQAMNNQSNRSLNQGYNMGFNQGMNMNK